MSNYAVNFFRKYKLKGFNSIGCCNYDGLSYWREQVLTYAHGPADFYRRADVLVNFLQSHCAGAPA